MNQLLASLSRFNRREQTILLVGAIAILLYVLWVALLAPLQHKRDRLMETNVATEQSLGKVKLLARQLENISQQSGHVGENITGLINSSLSENGLSLSGLQPGAGGEVRVRIDKANSDAMMQWLYDLETKHHIAIHDLSITSSNDPGQVAVNVRLVKL